MIPFYTKLLYRRIKKGKEIFIMRKALLLFTCFFVAGSLFGAASSESMDSDEIKIAMILPSAADDKGWSQGMYDAALRVAEANPGTMVVEYSDNMQPVDAGSAARQYIASGFKYLVFHGTQFGNTVAELAEEFPDVVFLFGTSAQIVGDNVLSYQPGTEQPGYLSGIIAGMSTKTNKVGIVGPVDGGDAAQYGRGFYLGVKSVNPDAEIGVAHTGSFNDYIKAGELAETFINEGYDRLAGSSQQGLGALQAVAKYPDEDVYWMGTSELHYDGPEGYKLLAACSYFWDPIYQAIVDAETEGNSLEGGKVFWLSIPNGGFTFSYAEDNPLITDEIAAAVEKATEELMSGELEIDWKSVEY